MKTYTSLAITAATLLNVGHASTALDSHALDHGSPEELSERTVSSEDYSNIVTAIDAMNTAWFVSMILHIFLAIEGVLNSVYISGTTRRTDDG